MFFPNFVNDLLFLKGKSENVILHISILAVVSCRLRMDVWVGGWMDGWGGWVWFYTHLFII
jgi:hypothetical protein